MVIFVASFCADRAATLSPTLSVLMALVTINAVVDISRHLVVLEILRIISAVTSGALEY